MFTDLQIPAGRRPLTRGEAFSAGIFLAIFFAMLLVGLTQDFKPVNASIFFILLFWGPMLVLHELGHAVAAWILGWKVGEISIGFGPQIFLKRWKGTDIRVRLVPLEGFVRPAPRSTGFGRIKKTIIFAAGPGIEFLVLAVMLGVYGWDGVFNSNQDYYSIALKSLAIVIVFGGGLQLIPFSTGGSVSDGLGMLTSAFTPEADLIDHQFALEFEEVKHLLNSNDPNAISTAGEIINPLCQANPQSFRLAFLRSKVELAAGRNDQCIQQTKSLVTPGMNAETKVELLFQIFIAELLREAPNYDAADSALASMEESLPKSTYGQIATGIIAIRRGQARKGGKILSDIFQTSSATNSELDPILLSHLTLAALQVNDRVAAGRFSAAFKSYPSPRHLRVQHERWWSRTG